MNNIVKIQQQKHIINMIDWKHELDPYLKLIKTYGKICVVGSFFSLDPDFNEIIRKGKIIQGWNTAGTKIGNQLLQFCAHHNILPEIQEITFDQLNDTRDKLVKSECRYRFVINIKV